LSFDLDQRNGWPADLRVLLERHPRDTWRRRRSVNAHFWLDIHDHFRRDCVALESAGEDYAEGRKAVHELAVISAPRLRGMIANLHGHHQIEDHHYFPAFREADPRLAKGFDLLESDHVALGKDIAAASDALHDLLAAAGSNTVAPNSAAELAARLYAAAGGRLYRRLCRHLSDEEDLIVPLLLERGDD
jgi:hypothetical protein